MKFLYVIHVERRDFIRGLVIKFKQLLIECLNARGDVDGRYPLHGKIEVVGALIQILLGCRVSLQR
jgi:hypothetical protein